jgi:hypothetical protein
MSARDEHLYRVAREKRARAQQERLDRKLEKLAARAEQRKAARIDDEQARVEQ